MPFGILSDICFDILSGIVSGMAQQRPELARVRARACPAASQACDMAVGSRHTPQHPELGVPRLLHSEGGRNKEEGGRRNL